MKLLARLRFFFPPSDFSLFPVFLITGPLRFVALNYFILSFNAACFAALMPSFHDDELQACIFLLVFVFILTTGVLVTFPLVSVRASELWAVFLYKP